MEKQFVKFATTTAKVTGRSWTFMACLAVVLIWAASGPVFGFSQTWQLIINTGTTIVTFLMVFLIQNTQNRDGEAIHAKLDEVIHAIRAADERFIGIEHLTEKDLDKILREVEQRAARIHGDGADALPVVATRAEDLKAARRPRKRPSSSPAPKRKATGPRKAGS
jgi:low affinity Fe/Cu permease